MFQLLLNIFEVLSVGFELTIGFAYQTSCCTGSSFWVPRVFGGVQHATAGAGLQRDVFGAEKNGNAGPQELVKILGLKNHRTIPCCVTQFSVFGTGYLKIFQNTLKSFKIWKPPMVLMVLMLNVISTILSMVCLEGHKNLWSRGLPPMAPCWHRKNAAGNGGNAPPAPAGNRGFKWLGKVGKMGYFQPINHIYIYIHILYIYIHIYIYTYI